MGGGAATSCGSPPSLPPSLPLRPGGGVQGEWDHALGVLGSPTCTSLLQAPRSSAGRAPQSQSTQPGVCQTSLEGSKRAPNLRHKQKAHAVILELQNRSRTTKRPAGLGLHTLGLSELPFPGSERRSLWCLRLPICASEERRCSPAQEALSTLRTHRLAHLAGTLDIPHRVG